ncbi:hypothetical protein PCANC_02069 [Puccinia coronata f. sp. avenae]|uniref:Uncharacterized protein n=1 Tax=Puccinia coronata f. sp. avenae TaxID=200324 RepID=A0A2N5W1X2_9BASI|nr:hypothetical protein PCANC_02069 [Puccinia coronata f. sp. avenae]
MARERIISLRHLSQEYNGLYLPGLAHQGGDAAGEISQVKPPNTASPTDYIPGLIPVKSGRVEAVGDDYPQAAHNNQLHISGEEHSRDTFSQSNPVKSIPRNPSPEIGYSQLSRDDDEAEGDMHTDVLVGVGHNHNMLHSALSRTSSSDDPMLQSDDLTLGTEQLEFLSHPAEVAHMGQFMNQVTKVSTRLDEMLAKILDNPSTFSNEPAFRAGLYEKIDQDVIRELITLQSKQLKHSKSPYLRHVTTAPCSNDVKGGMDAKIGSVPSAREIEEHLKTEQIDALKLKTQSLISGLITRLRDEKQIIANQIEYEWNKELHHGNNKSRHSSRKMGSAAHTGAGGDDSVQDDDSSNFHILSKLDLNHIRVDPKASKMYSAEVQKALNVAVTNSTSYPQARKSSIFIKSHFDLILRIEGELHQLDQILSLLSSPQTQSRTSLDERMSEDGSSTASISLAGFENDPSREIPLMSKTNKIRFSIHDRFRKNQKQDEQPLGEKEEPLSDKKCHRFSLYSDTVGKEDLEAAPIVVDKRRPCLLPYHIAIICVVVTIIILGGLALLTYFLLRKHDN